MSFSFVKVCPECGGEYRETVESCPDCGVPPLVKPPAVEEPAFVADEGSLPRAASPDLETLVETTLEHTKGVIGRLEDAGIRFRVERLEPPDSRSLSPAFGIPAYAGSYAVQVTSGDLAAALEVWNRYYRSLVPDGFTEAREGSCPACGAFLSPGREECRECGLVLS